MPGLIVDTNILLRLILRDDEKGLKTAEHMLATASPGSCRVTALVVSEVFYVLHIMGYPRDRAATTIAALLDHDQFVVDSFVNDTIKLFGKHNLDFADCYLITVALEDDVVLQTLDKKAGRLYTQLRE